MKTMTVILSLALIIAGLGCASLSSLVTPATIDTRAVDYAVDSGYAEPNTYAGYPNLDKAIRLTDAMTGSHQLNPLQLEQMMQTDRMEYAQINSVVTANKQTAIEREELLFGTEGLLTMGLSMAGFGTLTGVVGLMRKRPKDVTPEEVESVLADMSIDLEDKDRQIVELVRGVQAFLNSPQSSDAINSALKTLLATAQSADTKGKVAEVKVTL